MEGLKISYGQTPLKESFVNNIDTAINSKRKKYADYHKAVFHIHTPASYDYKLLEHFTANDYEELSDKEMYKIALQGQLFPESTLSYLELINLSNKYKEYDSPKDFLAFLLIAKKLVDENIKLAVIADHNTILGYRKLTKAIDIVCGTFANKTYTEISLGIEISCADKCHVVGIFNKSSRTINNLNDWISQNIMDPVSGTYKTSLDVLTNINELGGIGYIAHINTSDIFKPNFLSGGYKDHL